jgi:flagellar capping protein FliD
MRTACLPGTRRWLLLPAAALVLSGLAAGCGSSKPDYCTAASQLKTSVQDLGNITVNVSDLGSVKTAVGKVQANAKTFASEAKSAYAPQTTALRNSLSGLQSAVTSAQAQPSLTTVQAVVSSVSQVKTSASALQSAVAGKCQ